MTTQGPFLFGTSGASTTNFTNDTDFCFLGSQPYTSNPDWTQVIVGFVPEHLCQVLLRHWDHFLVIG